MTTPINARQKTRANAREGRELHKEPCIDFQEGKNYGDGI